jgi:hypothetical protein
MFSEQFVDLGRSNRLDSGKFELISAVSFSPSKSCSVTQHSSLAICFPSSHEITFCAFGTDDQGQKFDF